MAIVRDMKDAEEREALAERYLDLWERQAAAVAGALPWDFEAWLAMVNAARLRAEHGEDPGVRSEDPADAGT